MSYGAAHLENWEYEQPEAPVNSFHFVKYYADPWSPSRSLHFGHLPLLKWGSQVLWGCSET